MKLILSAFLIAHALIHASYLTPAPTRTAGGPEWPFEMTRSWLVAGLGLDPSIVRALGTVLVLTTIALLVAAGLAAAGVLVPDTLWPATAIGGAIASVVVLTMFFHPWIVLGFVIDAGLLYAALVARWTPEALIR